MHGNDPLMTIAEASQQLPGHPSIHAIWRWCRKGVLTRSGKRIFLKHVRLGRRVLTRTDWLEEFGQLVATGDSEHFLRDQDTPRPARVSVRTRSEILRKEQLAHVNRELDEAGL
jgi:hypothetical protein